MKILKIPSKYKVKMPDGSSKLMPVGMQYILKLEHMSSHKIFSRSIGPYQRKTGQPTQGKARGGGQRIGEGDVWALGAWDAENILKEFFSAGADDFRLKQQLYREILTNGSASLELLQEGTQQSKKATTNLFKGIMLEI
jgi:DNA-directed RNA polymerase subunit beta